ncbi:hypothetical protein ACQ4PT_068419 [Festuca glaucescens]
MTTPSTRLRGREQQQSSRTKSARNKLDGSGEQLPSEGCGKRKKAKLDGISRRVSSERFSKKGKSSQDRDMLEKKAKKRNRGEEEDDGSCSSAVSSPLREPYMPDGTEISKPINSAISDKYRDMQEEYYAKIDGEPLAWCSGFWMDLDSEKRTGTVVTTAHLIRTKWASPDAWLCKDEYASDVKVTVHLRGGAVANGCLLYHQKHYNLAFFRVKMDPSIQLPYFSDKVECAQDIFELGRDESAKLVIHHDRVEYSNPNVHERYHHMRIQGPHRDREYDNGGPVIDLDGKVYSTQVGSFLLLLISCSK